MKWKSVLLGVGLALGTIGVSASMATADGLVAQSSRTHVPATAVSNLAAAERAITATPELLYVPVLPCRIVDTRNAGGKFGSAITRNYYVAGTTGFAPQGGTAGGCGIPEGAKAFTGTMIVVSSEGVGYLRSYPFGTPLPNATTLNYGSGNGSTGFTTTISSGAGRDLSVSNFNTRTHLVIDVTGYYIPQLQAYVSASGTVLDQSGRLVSVSHPSPGYYLLAWDRDISSCSGQGTSDLSGYIASIYTSGATAQVRIYNHAGAAADYYFNIVINC